MLKKSFFNTNKGETKLSESSRGAFLVVASFLEYMHSISSLGERPLLRVSQEAVQRIDPELAISNLLELFPSISTTLLAILSQLRTDNESDVNHNVTLELDTASGSDALFFLAIVQVISEMDKRCRKIEAFLSPEGWIFDELQITADDLKLGHYSDEALVSYILREFGPLQDFSDVWFLFENPGFNAHGREHIELTAKNAVAFCEVYESFTGKTLTIEEKRQLLLAALFHDIGIAIGGKKDHEVHAILLLEEIFKTSFYNHEDRETDPFFVRVGELILNHVSHTFDRESLFRDNDVLRVLLILSDELQLTRRVTDEGEDIFRYAQDDFIKIVFHMLHTDILVEENRLVLNFETDQGMSNKLKEVQASYPDLAAQIQREGRDNMAFLLQKLIFQPKAQMFWDCFALIFKNKQINPIEYADIQGKVLVRVDGQDYELKSDGSFMLFPY